MKTLSSEPAEFSLENMYRAFRHEVEKRKLRGPKLERDSDEESGAEWFTYIYEPESPDELDFGLVVAPEGELDIFIGPAQSMINMVAVERPVKEWAGQLADIAQMALNGQLVVLLTERDGDNAWQAAELVWTDEYGHSQVVMTISNHEHSKDPLHARVLKNSDKYPLLHLSDEHPMNPAKVNGDYLYARTVDLEHPAPLTKKEFKEIEFKQPVQLTGGDVNKTIWHVFYRRIEFWLIATIVMAMYIFVTLHWLSGGSFFEEVMRSVLGLAVLFVITLLSTIALTWRQMALDAGKQPLGEKVERWLFSRIPLAIAVAVIATVAYASPIWTPRYDIHHLYTAFQLPGLLLLPVTLGVLLYIVSLFVIPRITRADKILRFLLFGAGFGLLIYTDMVICYGGDDAAMANEWLTYVMALLPIAILIGLAVDIFKKLPPKI